MWQISCSITQVFVAKICGNSMLRFDIAITHYMTSHHKENPLLLTILKE